MRSSMKFAGSVLVLILILGVSNPSLPKSSSPGQALWFPGNMELVGHNELLGRGMNAALAVSGDYVYVGSRTEGETHQNAGVLIVDVSDPANPTLAGEIGPPDEGSLASPHASFAPFLTRIYLLFSISLAAR